MITVHPVDVKLIARAWPSVEGFLAMGLEHTDDYTVDQVKVYLASGAWLLLVAVDEDNNVHGAMTIAFDNGPNYRTAILTTLGGKQVVNEDVFKQVCNILKSMGATRVQAYARDSAARLYEKVGMHKKATLTEIKI